MRSDIQPELNFWIADILLDWYYLTGYAAIHNKLIMNYLMW